MTTRTLVLSDYRDRIDLGLPFAPAAEPARPEAFDHLVHDLLPRPA